MGRRPFSGADAEPFAADDPLSALLDRLLTIEQIVALTHTSATTIRRMVGRGEFPKPLTIGGGMIRWRARDYNAWIAAQAPENA